MGKPAPIPGSASVENLDHDVDHLAELIAVQVERIARLPPVAWSGALSRVHSEHRRSGLAAGMSADAALEMADRLDGWIRATLVHRAGRPPTDAVH